VPVPPGFRQVCPTAIPTRTRHLRRVAPTKLQWRWTCTGQRTKRRTRRRRFVRGMTLLTPVHGLRRAHADVVPFLGVLWTSAVAGASPSRGGVPLPTTDRPRSAFRRHPAKETAIPQTGMPFHRHDRKGSPPRITPRRLPCAGPSLTPPTRSPLGRGAFTGLASTTVRSPAIRGLRETSRLYNLLDFYVPGTDDPSTPAWLGRRDRSRRLIASARFYADRSA
jgi:hypothetical protein